MKLKEILTLEKKKPKKSDHTAAIILCNGYNLSQKDLGEREIELDVRKLTDILPQNINDTYIPLQNRIMLAQFVNNNLKNIIKEKK